MTTDQGAGATPFRVIVTGSRDWSDEQLVRDALDRLLDELTVPGACRELVIVHGDCPTGADFFAGRWGFDSAHQGVEVEAHPAGWNAHGKAAGPLRNAHMVSLGADLCLAFPLPLGPSRGTRDCMKKADAAGIPVRVVVPVMAAEATA